MGAATDTFCIARPNPNDKTPELARAVRKSIEGRIEARKNQPYRNPGWSHAWLINLWARLKENEKAYSSILLLLRSGKISSNLFANMGPKRVIMDANGGLTAGIAEMLLQSHAGYIELLPALPSAWSKGHVKGLCARGAFEIDIYWNKGKLTKAFITSKCGNRAAVRYGKKSIAFNTRSGQTYRLDHDLNLIV